MAVYILNRIKEEISCLSCRLLLLKKTFVRCTKIGSTLSTQLGQPYSDETKAYVFYYAIHDAKIVYGTSVVIM